MISQFNIPSKSNLIKLGTVIKTHGIHGEVIIIDESESLTNEYSDAFFIEMEGQLVPFFAQKNGIKQRNNESFLTLFENINTDNDAKRIVNKMVYILHQHKKKKKISEEIGLDQLIGFEVKNTNSPAIGILSEIIDIPNNPLLKIMNQEKEILIPVNSMTIQDINFESKSMRITIPNGLLEIF